MIDINDYIQFLNEEDRYKMLSRYRSGAFIDDENTADSLSYRQAAKNYNKALRKYYSGMNGYDEDGDFIGFNRPFQNTNYVNYHPLDIQENLEEKNTTAMPKGKNEFYIGLTPENLGKISLWNSCKAALRKELHANWYDEVIGDEAKSRCLKRGKSKLFCESLGNATTSSYRKFEKNAKRQNPITYNLCSYGMHVVNPLNYLAFIPKVGIPLALLYEMYSAVGESEYSDTPSITIDVLSNTIPKKIMKKALDTPYDATNNIFLDTIKDKVEEDLISNALENLE